MEGEDDVHRRRRRRLVEGASFAGCGRFFGAFTTPRAGLHRREQLKIRGEGRHHQPVVEEAAPTLGSSWRQSASRSRVRSRATWTWPGHAERQPSAELFARVEVIRVTADHEQCVDAAPKPLPLDASFPSAEGSEIVSPRERTAAASSETKPSETSARTSREGAAGSRVTCRWRRGPASVVEVIEEARALARSAAQAAIPIAREPFQVTGPSSLRPVLAATPLPSRMTTFAPIDDVLAGLISQSLPVAVGTR